MTFGRTVLGGCPMCKEGKLWVVRSRKSGKRFVGCTNYAKGCRASAPLPQRGTIKAALKPCGSCGWPVVYVRLGRRPWRLCVNDRCPRKVNVYAMQNLQKKEHQDIARQRVLNGVGGCLKRVKGNEYAGRRVKEVVKMEELGGGFGLIRQWLESRASGVERRLGKVAERTGVSTTVKNNLIEVVYIAGIIVMSAGIVSALASPVNQSYIDLPGNQRGDD